MARCWYGPPRGLVRVRPRGFRTMRSRGQAFAGVRGGGWVPWQGDGGLGAALFEFLRPGRRVGRPLVVLPGLAEHGQECRSTILPSAARQYVTLWGARGGQAAYLIDALEVAVTEAVQPVTALRFALEAIHALEAIQLCPAAHAGWVTGQATDRWPALTSR